MRVLIVKTSALGDIIHALPVLDYLKQVSPDIEIDWVVEEHCRDVLAGNPLISRLHVIRTRHWRKHPLEPATWREIATVKRKLQDRDYRIIFDIQGNLKSGLVDHFAKAPAVLGFTTDILQEKINTLFTTQRIPLATTDYHITDQYLRIVSNPYGKDFSFMRLKSDIFTSREDDQPAERLLSALGKDRIFLFHYGTTWQTKFWSEDNWIALGKQLLLSYPGTIILLSWGNEAEKQTVMRLAQAIGAGSLVTERYSIKELAGLLKRVTLVVGGDTGPVHLAAAVGTPTVSLYRSSDARRSGPRGAGQVVIQSPLHCAGCFRTTCSNDTECRASITVSSVINGIEQALADYRQARLKITQHEVIQ